MADNEDPLDDIALALEGILCKQNIDVLKHVAERVSIKKEDVEDKTTREIKYMITKSYEEILDDEETTDEEKKLLLNNIAIDLQKNVHKEDVAEVKIHGNSIVGISGGGGNVVGASGGSDADDDKVVKGERKQPGKVDIIRELSSLKTSLLRKDLKIRGHIGELGQKDKLTYLNLSNQIAEAQTRGYEDREMVHAVTRAMVPSLTLRNVLEKMLELSLPRLEQFI